jgi:co-chaperonin GroES (HSP10)
MKFVPVAQHIMIKPEEITNTLKKVQTEGGREIEILMGDRSKDLAIKAVNKGKIVRSSSKLYKKGQVLVYYPFSPNKLDVEGIEHHIIHERDVMGIVED